MLASDNSVLNVDETRYYPIASHYLFYCVNDIAEPVLIQTLIAQLSVKALNGSCSVLIVAG